MGGETFASYMLGEKDWLKKMEIMYYLKKKTGIFYDNTVVFKTLITKLFLDYLHENYPEENIDDNLVITARLLCDCMKKENALALTLRNIDQKREKIQQQLGLEGVKLSELPGKVSDEEARPKVKQAAEELQAQYRVMRSATEVARSALECSLYEVESMMTKMGIDPRQVEQQPASSNGAHTDFRA